MEFFVVLIDFLKKDSGLVFNTPIIRTGLEPPTDTGPNLFTGFMKKHLNLSHMMIKGWVTKYSEIRKEFGYQKDLDLESAILLNLILKKYSTNKLESKIRGKIVFVIGAGPSLLDALPYLKKYKVTIIAADSAVKPLLENGITPDIVVTDLDGDEFSLKKVGKTRCVMVVHAHGDNIAKLPLVSNFKNCLGTTQTSPVGKIKNFGGFTDGDRCVFLASYFNAKKIILFGMDFGTRIGKYSKTKKSEKQIKIKKLKMAKELLEWLGHKTKSKLYTTSKPIKGFERITLDELSEIIIT